MKDTQWPQYIVFDQPREGKPAFYAGAVHAPDPEMAIQNARDVFGRREDHVRLWVVRETYIYALTDEQINDSAIQRFSDSPIQQSSNPANQQANPPIPYLVFQKTAHKGTLVQVGEVLAADPEEAMTKAIEKSPNSKAIVWWVFPASAIHQTDPAENDVLFGPAYDKPFRHSNFYPTVTLMREISLANEKLNWEEE